VCSFCLIMSCFDLFLRVLFLFFLSCFVSLTRPGPKFKLFPYTTLFRSEVKGNFDHFGIDLKGGRLFATPEGYHAVVVFDLNTGTDRKSTRLNSSHGSISYAVFCLKKKITSLLIT